MVILLPLNNFLCLAILLRYMASWIEFCNGGNDFFLYQPVIVEAALVTADVDLSNPFIYFAWRGYEIWLQSWTILMINDCVFEFYKQMKPDHK